MINKQEFEMLCACVDVAIKQSQDSRQAALQLHPVLIKLEQHLEKAVEDGNAND